MAQRKKGGAPAGKGRGQKQDREPLRVWRATVPPALNDPGQREELGLSRDESEPDDYMIELNLLYRKGLTEAKKRFEDIYQSVLKANVRQRPASAISKSYYRCRISVKEWQALVAKDEEADDPRDRCIYKVWPDFAVGPLMDRSISTVKGDAAVRSYEATGDGIVWAVIDSGIDHRHRHFAGQVRGMDPNKDVPDPERDVLLHPSVASLHRDFTGGDPPPIDPDRAPKENPALRDDFGHGTHVAGIIAGGLPETFAPSDFRVYEQVFESGPGGDDKRVVISERKHVLAERLHGVAPRCRLISLKVLDGEGRGRASDVMAALSYIREELNGDPKILRVHGVNLSVGYEFDAEMFACGQSPLCLEVDRLVKSGVVVVVAAGNTGYGKIPAQARPTKIGLSNTINDPGNSAMAITVGATHRDSPHTYGVSYFSSKGPTGDGRLKPDLVAPGERITSCAAGKKLRSLGGPVADDKPRYLDDTGTSMAAPHVSGAIAAFLSIRREFIQRPEEVKRIFLESATPLGREKYFEGHGLLDLMRAIQSI